MNLLLAVTLAAATSLPQSVYVTEGGTKYHAKCHAEAGCIQVSRTDAEAAGYLPCKPCFTPKKAKTRPYDRLPKGVK